MDLLVGGRAVCDGTIEPLMHAGLARASSSKDCARSAWRRLSLLLAGRGRRPDGPVPAGPWPAARQDATSSHARRAGPCGWGPHRFPAHGQWRPCWSFQGLDNTSRSLSARGTSHIAGDRLQRAAGSRQFYRNALSEAAQRRQATRSWWTCRGVSSPFFGARRARLQHCLAGLGECCRIITSRCVLPGVEGGPPGAGSPAAPAGRSGAFWGFGRRLLMAFPARLAPRLLEVYRRDPRFVKTSPADRVNNGKSGVSARPQPFPTDLSCPMPFAHPPTCVPDTVTKPTPDMRRVMAAAGSRRR